MNITHPTHDITNNTEPEPGSKYQSVYLVLFFRASEIEYRRLGLYDRAVQFQQRADAEEKGDAIGCEFDGAHRVWNLQRTPDLIID